jgi:hypothetical protein
MSTVTKLEESEKASSAAGIAVSVIVTILFSLGLILRLTRFSDADGQQVSPTAEHWKAHAQRSITYIIIGNVLLCFSICATIAGITIPWGSLSFSSSEVSYYYSIDAFNLKMQSCDSTMCSTVIPYFNVYMFGGAIIIYFSNIFFTIPAYTLSLNASLRIMRVYKYGVMPRTTGCCLPSLTAIQGLGWFSFILTLIGYIFAVTLYAIAYSGFGGILSSTIFKAEAGSGFTVAGIIALFIANILFSIAGCCSISNLPGIGRSRTCCCCVEKDSNAVSYSSTAVAYAQPVTGGIDKPPSSMMVVRVAAAS